MRQPALLLCTYEQHEPIFLVHHKEKSVIIVLLILYEDRRLLAVQHDSWQLLNGTLLDLSSKNNIWKILDREITNWETTTLSIV